MAGKDFFVHPLKRRNIGLRTGKPVIKPGKVIKKDKDGFDVFDEYFSESDAEHTFDLHKSSIELRQPLKEVEDDRIIQSQPEPANSWLTRNRSSNKSLASSVTSKVSSQSSYNPVAWIHNKNIGRRTGKNIKAGKVIRKRPDGFENFEDYWSESDADSMMLSRLEDKSRINSSSNQQESSPSQKSEDKGATETSETENSQEEDQDDSRLHQFIPQSPTSEKVHVSNTESDTSSDDEAEVKTADKTDSNESFNQDGNQEDEHGVTDNNNGGDGTKRESTTFNRKSVNSLKDNTHSDDRDHSEIYEKDAKTLDKSNNKTLTDNDESSDCKSQTVQSSQATLNDYKSESISQESSCLGGNVESDSGTEENNRQSDGKKNSVQEEEEFVESRHDKSHNGTRQSSQNSLHSNHKTLPNHTADYSNVYETKSGASEADESVNEDEELEHGSNTTNRSSNNIVTKSITSYEITNEELGSSDNELKDLSSKSNKSTRNHVKTTSDSDRSSSDDNAMQISPKSSTVQQTGSKVNKYLHKPLVMKDLDTESPLTVVTMLPDEIKSTTFCELLDSNKKEGEFTENENSDQNDNHEHAEVVANEYTEQMGSSKEDGTKREEVRKVKKDKLESKLNKSRKSIYGYLCNTSVDSVDSIVVVEEKIEHVANKTMDMKRRSLHGKKLSRKSNVGDKSKMHEHEQSNTEIVNKKKKSVKSSVTNSEVDCEQEHVNEIDNHRQTANDDKSKTSHGDGENVDYVDNMEMHQSEINEEQNDSKQGEEEHKNEAKAKSSKKGRSGKTARKISERNSLSKADLKSKSSESEENVNYPDSMEMQESAINEEQNDLVQEEKEPTSETKGKSWKKGKSGKTAGKRKSKSSNKYSLRTRKRQSMEDSGGSVDQKKTKTEDNADESMRNDEDVIESEMVQENHNEQQSSSQEESPADMLHAGHEEKQNSESATEAKPTKGKSLKKNKEEATKKSGKKQQTTHTQGDNETSSSQTEHQTGNFQAGDKTGVSAMSRTTTTIVIGGNVTGSLTKEEESTGITPTFRTRKRLSYSAAALDSSQILRKKKRQSEPSKSSKEKVVNEDNEEANKTSKKTFMFDTDSEASFKFLSLTKNTETEVTNDVDTAEDIADVRIENSSIQTANTNVIVQKKKGKGEKDKKKTRKSENAKAVDVENQDESEVLDIFNEVDDQPILVQKDKKVGHKDKKDSNENEKRIKKKTRKTADKQKSSTSSANDSCDQPKLSDENDVYNIDNAYSHEEEEDNQISTSKRNDNNRNSLVDLKEVENDLVNNEIENNAVSVKSQKTKRKGRKAKKKGKKKPVSIEKDSVNISIENGENENTEVTSDKEERSNNKLSVSNKKRKVSVPDSQPLETSAGSEDKSNKSEPRKKGTKNNRTSSTVIDKHRQTEREDSIKRSQRHTEAQSLVDTQEQPEVNEDEVVLEEENVSHHVDLTDNNGANPVVDSPASRTSITNSDTPRNNYTVSMLHEEAIKSGVSFRRKRRTIVNEDETNSKNKTSTPFTGREQNSLHFDADDNNLQEDHNHDSLDPETLVVSRTEEDIGGKIPNVIRRRSSFKYDPPTDPINVTPIISKTKSKTQRKERRVTINRKVIETSYDACNSTGSSGLEKTGNITNVSEDTQQIMNATPVHIFEMTSTQTPDNIPHCKLNQLISPEPAPDGLRRSKRTRVKPLAGYKLELPRYERRKSGGLALVGIVPSYGEAKLKEIEKKRKQKVLSKKKLKENRRLSGRRLSAHIELPSDVNTTLRTELTVHNPDTDQDVMLECIGTHQESARFGPHQGEPVKDDPFFMTRSLSQPAFGSGMIQIKGLMEKPLQKMTKGTLIFHVIFGKLLVTIQCSSVILSTNDSFFVPRGNAYSIKNLRKDNAKLSYVMLREDESEEETDSSS